MISPANERPSLREIQMGSVDIYRDSRKSMTIDVGAWDVMIEEAYDDGWFLIEIDDDTPVRMFHRKEGVAA